MNIREIAVKVIEEVIYNKAYSNIVLDKALSNEKINQIDKNFITKLVHGVLQNYYLLDYKLKKLTDKKIKRKVQLILLVSIYQIDYMDKIPNYAVINEANKLTKSMVDSYAAKFVNALLQNYLNIDIQVKQEDFTDYSAYLSVKYSMPLFIVKLFLKQYGEDITIKIFESTLVNPKLSIRINSFKTSKENLLKNTEYTNANLDSSLFYKGKTRESLNKDLKEGLISIQDEAGQLIAPLLDLKEDDLILDMCAAPGSKTCHMGEILKNKGKIIAIDLYEHRLDLLNKAACRLGLTNITTRAYNSTKLNEIFENNSFNKILLDAPCSGLGVIRRKMDIKFNVSPESIDELTILQEKMLEVSYSLLKVNGTLVYSTCTLNKKENEKQIIKFINKHLDMKVIEEKTILPFENDSDGFYYCKMIKEG